MSPPESSWNERAATALSEAGFRSGGGRRQVVDLLGTQSCAVTALEIDRSLPEVGRATVYRAIEQLEGLERLGGGEEIRVGEREVQTHLAPRAIAASASDDGCRDRASSIVMTPVLTSSTRVDSSVCMPYFMPTCITLGS